MRRSLIFAVTGTLLASCGASQEVAEATNIVARWSTCDKSAGGSTNNTVLEKSAWADNKLVIDVKDNDYCGGTVVSNLGYAVDGNNLNIRWAWTPKQSPGGAPAPLTACKCDHVLRFELSNIPRREFNIGLLRSR